jgi:hypothetical protein
MARTGSETTPTPADHQQMDRSNDPAVTAEMNALAPAVAMTSRHQRLTGSAHGVGSVGFDDPGVFDVGAGPDAPPPELYDTHALPEPGHPRGDSGAQERLGSGGVSPSGDPGPQPYAKRMTEADSFIPEHDPDERRLSGGPVAPAD